MGGRFERSETAFHVIETVRCLSCGAVYSRPRDRSTAIANPGCPDCSYVGWVPLKQASRPLRFRFGADRPHSRPA
jgi:hypothetical protein